MTRYSRASRQTTTANYSQKEKKKKKKKLGARDERVRIRLDVPHF